MEIDTLLVGSSNIKRWYKFPKRSPIMQNRNLGILGALTADVIIPTYILQIMRYHPKNLIYMIGNNDITNGIYPLFIERNIRKFVIEVNKRYLKNLMRTKIVICSLIHRPKITVPNERRIIDTINRNLRIFLANMEHLGIVFVDINPGLQSDHFIHDGVHFNGAGYSHIYTKINRYLRQ